MFSVPKAERKGSVFWQEAHFADLLNKTTAQSRNKQRSEIEFINSTLSFTFGGISMKQHKSVEMEFGQKSNNKIRCN